MRTAHGETERETVLYNKQFDKLLHDVSYGGTHSANLQPFGDWSAQEKGMEEGKGRLAKDRVSSRSSHFLGEEAICANV